MPDAKKQSQKKAAMQILNGNRSDNFYKNAIAMEAKALIPDYVFDENNKQLFSDLFYYFMGRDGNLDLKKGIAITGVYGVGKSTVFQIFHNFLKKYFPFNDNLFRISSIEEVIGLSQEKDFMQSVILYNSKNNINGIPQPKPVHVLINEFGHKYDIKNWGTNVNETIDLFLMKRYDIFQQRNKLLHVTTNYDTDNFKEMFDPRIVDRFKEMFNIIELKGKSFRK